jgi:cytochrome c oxidase subunit 2
MILLLKLHIPKVRKYTLRCVLKMFFTRRTCLILELKMNCVPGMVTEFAFEPIYTTAEYRSCMVKKVANINAIRAKKYWSCCAR